VSDLEEQEVLKLVGRKIRELRKMKVLSQEKLGELANFHFSYIGRVENGKKNISLNNLTRIANALEVNVSDFFSDIRDLAAFSDRDVEIKEIVVLLQEQDRKKLIMVKNVVKEIIQSGI
jgi:transcriptional regulator with XRE-family HTH domain